MNDTGDTTVTIGIPAYNRIEYLREAVTSALSQTILPDEIIISQNAHSNADIDADVRQAVELLSLKSHLIRTNRNEHDCNLSTNINSIADLATSEYIAIIGDDDRLKDNFVETVKKCFQSEPDVVFGDHDVIDSDGNLQLERSKSINSRFYRDRLPIGRLESTVSKTAAWKCAVPIFSAAIRSETLREHRLVDDLYGADTEFFARLAERGGSFLYTGSKLAEIRYHDGNIQKPGVQYAKLVECLNDIDASEEVAELKRDLISRYTITAVKKLILEGKVTEARKFLLKFGPTANRAARSRIAFQRFCLCLPDRLAILFFSASSSVLRGLTKNRDATQ